MYNDDASYYASLTGKGGDGMCKCAVMVKVIPSDTSIKLMSTVMASNRITLWFHLYCAQLFSQTQVL